MGEVISLGVEAGMLPDFGNGNIPLPTPEQAWMDYAEGRRVEARQMIDRSIPTDSYALRMAIDLLVRWSVDAALAKAGKS